MAACGRTRLLTSRGSKAALAASGTLALGAIVGAGAEVVSRVGPSNVDVTSGIIPAGEFR